MAPKSKRSKHSAQHVRLSDCELLKKFKTNYTALPKEKQAKVAALFAKRDKQEQKEFKEAQEMWLNYLTEGREAPLDVVKTVVYGLERGLS
jgi:hypothetical protein